MEWDEGTVRRGRQRAAHSPASAMGEEERRVGTAAREKEVGRRKEW